jgi:hypothetical protein
MSEYSIRRVISLSGVTDVRFVDSSASTPTFSGITINNDLGVGGIISGDGSGITNLVLSGASNYYVTGFTYDNLNQLTLERNGVLILVGLLQLQSQQIVFNLILIILVIQ